MSGRRKKMTAKDKQLRTHFATQRSIKTVSELSLENAEEDALVQLLFSLDDGKTAAEAAESNKSANLIDISNEDGTTEGLIEDTAAAVGKLTLTLTEMKRKIIRDDRRIQLEFEASGDLSSEKIAQRLRRSINTSTAKTSSSGTVNFTQMDAEQPKATNTKVSSSLRVWFDLDKGKKQQQGKLVVIDRQISLTELLPLMRGKFNVGAKYNTIMHAATLKQPYSKLNDEDIALLADGSVLKLASVVSGPSEKPSMKKLVKERTDEILYQQQEEHETSLPPPSQPEATEEKQKIKADDDIDEEEEILLAPPLPIKEEEVIVEDVWEVPTRLEQDEHHRPTARINPPNLNINLSLYTQLTGNQSNENYRRTILAQRQALPIHASRSQILQMINDNQVTVICGETGSGKTTQTALYILEDMIMQQKGSECSIICTQPRRIAATSVAERVSYEAKQGKAGEGLVGYQVRLDARCSEQTRLLFCTPGVLLRRLQSPTIWEGVSHIILDEVHERGVETDFLMAILKQQLSLQPQLKVILMSATLQEELFTRYFNDCPVLYIAGRTHPVEIHYLDKALAACHRKAEFDNNNSSNKGSNKSQQKNSSFGKNKAKHEKDKSPQENDFGAPKFGAELVADLIMHIISRPSVTHESHPYGEAVLVFLSGMQAIEQTSKALKMRPAFQRMNNVALCLLHGSMAPEQQRQVFKRAVPGGWKVVLATNIAETSLTVEDVTHVIDTGFVKETRYNPAAGLSSLQEVFISRSSAAQRAGRAGRVRPGQCWRLYSSVFLSDVNPAMMAFPLPEIQRMAIEEIVLQVLLLRLGRPDVFLGMCLQPPSPQQLKDAVATLIEIQAVKPLPALPLTALGFHLARLPVDVKLGKMLVYAVMLRCLEPALTVAAALSGKPIFLAPIEQRGTARRVHLEHYGGHSDHIATVRAFDEWREVIQVQGGEGGYRHCRERFISHTRLNEVQALRELFREQLDRAGLLANHDLRAEEEKLNVTEQQLLLKCVLCAGFAPNIIRAIEVMTQQGKTPQRKVKFIQGDGKEVSLHPASLLCGLKSDDLIPEDTHDAFLVYYVKTATVQQAVGTSSTSTAAATATVAPSTIQRISLFDVTVIPHACLLLFSSGEVSIQQAPALAFASKRQQRRAELNQRNRRCLRAKVGGWIEMDLSELLVGCMRRLQREIESLMREKVERALGRPSSEQEQEKVSARLNIVRQAVGILMRSSLGEEDVEEEEEDEVDESDEEDFEELNEDDDDEEEN